MEEAMDLSQDRLHDDVPATVSMGSDMWPVFELDIIRLRSGIRTWNEKKYMFLSGTRP